MNILVTGGAGFIGSNLVHYLLQDASKELGVSVHKVVILDLLTYAGSLSNLISTSTDPRHIFVKGSITDRELIRQILNDHEIDSIMHLAAESHVDRSIARPDDFIETNVVGTFCLLDEFRQYLDAKNLRDSGRFLHVSTDEVYGSLLAGDDAFCESTPYAPNSPYSASKAGGDHLARAYYHTYGFPVIITNCSNNYGPHQFPEKLIPLMIHRILQGESLPVYGNGENVRDWLYVRDHVRALTMVLFQGEVGETYVIGGRCEMKNVDVIHELIQTVRELTPGRAIKSPEEFIQYVPDRLGHDYRYAIDPTKIENDLGWAPVENFSSGIRKTVPWYLEQEQHSV